jgi:predicted AAA+ superfamily ATPase
VAGTTIERWLGVLQQFFYCFIIRPWSKNISRSLLKEPKVFLWNWADIEDEGARFENFVALHLLKATQLWMDLGLGEYALYYLRDKEKNEVDFCVIKNGLPWFLVEVKLSAKQGISKALYHFQKQTKAAHAFQVVRDMDFVDEDCFAHHDPIKVPALTFLSQLL